MKFEERLSVTLTNGEQKIFAILHLPLGVIRAPCALFCNGFGGFKSAKYRLAVRQAELLSKAGIATFRFDYRGTGDSEGVFSDVTIKSQLDDARVCINYLQHHEALDSTRLGVLGRSMGGVIATKLAAEILPRALMLWAPVFDATPWLDGRSSHRAVRYEDDGITFAGQKLNADFLSELPTLSVETSLSAISQMPLCVIQGEQDAVLHDFHLQKYIAARKEAAGATETLLLPKSDHDFHSPQEQEILLDATTAWFSRFLKE